MKRLLLVVAVLAALVGCSKQSPSEENTDYKTYDLVCYDGITRLPIRGLSVILKAADTGSASEQLITDDNGRASADLYTKANVPSRMYADVTNSGVGNSKYLSWNGLLVVTPIDDGIRGRIYVAEIHMALAGASK
jgi:hypothetical protein